MKKPKNILVLTSWNYEDGLIQAYTLPYIRIIKKYLPRGSKIILVTLEKKNMQKELVAIEEGIENLQLAYVPFSAKAGFDWFKNIFKLFFFIRKNKIDKIHAWCTPAGMIGYILSVITFRKLIIDSYEPHAEAMVENREWKKDSFAFRLLFEFERLQTKGAQHLIATTNGMKNYARSKYEHRKNNVFVKPACVDLTLFGRENIKKISLQNELGLNGKRIVVYAGKFGGIYLQHEVFDFFKVAADFWGQDFRILLLTSQSRIEIEKWANQSGLNPEIIISRFVPHNEIPDYMGLADFALTPVKPVYTKRFCTPVKDGEYWALGLPVVITKNISDDSDIIKETETGSIINEFNKEDYQRVVREIDLLLKNNSRQEIYYKVRPLAEKYRNYEIAENIYQRIYGS